MLHILACWYPSAIFIDCVAMSGNRVTSVAIACVNTVWCKGFTLNNAVDLVTTDTTASSLRWSIIRMSEAETNGRHFPYDIFIPAFLDEKSGIVFHVPLKFGPKCSAHNKSALVHIDVASSRWKAIILGNNGPLPQHVNVSFDMHTQIEYQ